MNNLRTTVAGAVGGVATIIAAFGFQVPQEVTTGIIAVTVFLIGLFASDSTPA